MFFFLLFFTLSPCFVFFSLSFALSLSHRLVSQYLYNCFREFSGYSTVTGLTLFRRPQWRLALKYSQTWVRYWANTNHQSHVILERALWHMIKALNRNIYILTSTQLRAEPLPSQWTWTVRWTTCLSSPIMLCRRASSAGDSQLRTLPDETPAWRPPKTTGT